MNGKDLMEAMGYVDESFLAEAEAAVPARRRVIWQPIAAAACIGLAVLGYQAVDSRNSSGNLARSVGMPMLDAEVEMAEAAPMLLSVTAQMTVQLTGQEGDTLLCTVTDSGSGTIPVGTQLRIVPPEQVPADTANTAFRAAKEKEDTLLSVFYDPDTLEGDLLPALEIQKAE